MNHPHHRRQARWLIGLGALAASLALVPLGTAAASSRAAAMTPVTFEDDFTTNGTDAGYIVAEEPNGYYNQQGITLQYSPGTGSPATAQAVASGQQMFGEITTSALVTAVAQGEPIRAVALVSGQDGFGVVADANITSPAQLVGKTVTTASPFLVPIFQAFLKAKGVDPSQVNIVSVAPAALDTSVTSGQAQACLCVAFSDRLRIDAAGTATNDFPFTDVGLGFTGNVIITNTNTIQNSPDVVRRFVKASLQGWNFAFDNPNLAAGDLQGEVANQSPLATAKTNVQTIRIMRKGRYTKNNAGHPYGWMSVLDWANAIKQLKLEGVLTIAPPAASALFTNAFIPAAPAKAKKK